MYYHPRPIYPYFLRSFPAFRLLGFVYFVHGGEEWTLNSKDVPYLGVLVIIVFVPDSLCVVLIIYTLFASPISLHIVQSLRVTSGLSLHLQCIRES